MAGTTNVMSDHAPVTVLRCARHHRGCDEATRYQCNVSADHLFSSRPESYAERNFAFGPQFCKASRYRDLGDLPNLTGHLATLVDGSRASVNPAV
jgi:hypothetical protein